MGCQVASKDLEHVAGVQGEFQPYRLIVKAAVWVDLIRVDVVQVYVMQMDGLRVDVVKIVLFSLR